MESEKLPLPHRLRLDERDVTRDSFSRTDEAAARIRGARPLAFSATTKIDRRDFGLTWNQALETGGVLVSNEIKISIDVQAVKAP